MIIEMLMMIGMFIGFLAAILIPVTVLYILYTIYKKVQDQ